MIKSIRSKINIEIRESTLSPGEYYVVNQKSINEILDIIKHGLYCTILGPRYCQKTQLLYDIQSELHRMGNSVTLLIDFRVSKDIEIDWPEHFVELIEAKIEAITGQVPDRPVGIVQDDIFVQRYIQTCVEHCYEHLSSKLYLLLNGLERLPLPIIKRLLVVLRAIYNEQAGDSRTLLVVAATSFQLYGLALGPTSPFNISKNVIIHDMSENEVFQFVWDWTNSKNIKMKDPAIIKLWQGTKGDRILIYDLMVSLISDCKNREITLAAVECILNTSIIPGSRSHSALTSTARILESKPELLLDAMNILNHGRAIRSELHHSIKEQEVDSLELSGGFTRHKDKDTEWYTVRNRVYELFLKNRFNCTHVAQVLKFAGCWDEAFKYLQNIAEERVETSGAQKDLLIDWIHSVHDENEALVALAGRIRSVLGCKRIFIYQLETDSGTPVLVSKSGIEIKEVSTKLPIHNENMLNKVINEATTMYEYEENMEKNIIMPFKSKEEPLVIIGATVLEGCECCPGGFDSSAFQELLNEVGHALLLVRKREKRAVSAYNVYKLAKKILAEQDKQKVYSGYVELAVNAITTAEKGALLLWNNDNQRLEVVGHYGYENEDINKISLEKEVGYVGWSFSTQKPVLIPEAQKNERTIFFDHLPGVPKEKSGICSPLEAWGKTLGAICLHIVYGAKPFNEDDLSTLANMAPYIAMAIQNAVVSRELYDCGIVMHQTNRKEIQIFRILMASMKKISNLSASNLLIFKESPYSDQNYLLHPQLSYSEGFGDENDSSIPQWAMKIAHATVQNGRPNWVAEFEMDKDLNPRAIKQEVKASLCLPIIWQESIRGVLFIHYNERHEFSNSEISAFELFTNQAALAIENAVQRRDLTLANSITWMGFTYSNLVHDAKQLIAAMNWSLYSIDLEAQKYPEINIVLRRNITNAKDCTERIKEVLYKSIKPLKTDPKILSLAGYLKEKVNLWCQSDSDINVTYESEPNDISVIIDDTHLELLIKILTTNAVRAMAGNKSDNKYLSIKVKQEEDRVWVWINDSGTGITKKIQDKLFYEPILKEDGTGGAGVGLLIAKGILKLSGGDIMLEESSEKGSKIRFVLPSAPSISNRKGLTGD